jgi:hypothetical protein
MQLDIYDHSEGSEPTVEFLENIISPIGFSDSEVLDRILAGWPNSLGWTT